MYLCCFLLITSNIFQQTNQLGNSLWGNYDGYLKHERNNITCNPCDPQGDEKDAVSISIALRIDILIRNEYLIPEKHQTEIV